MGSTLQPGGAEHLSWLTRPLSHLVVASSAEGFGPTILRSEVAAARATSEQCCRRPKVCPSFLRHRTWRCCPCHCIEWGSLRRPDRGSSPEDRSVSSFTPRWAECGSQWRKPRSDVGLVFVMGLVDVQCMCRAGVCTTCTSMLALFLFPLRSVPNKQVQGLGGCR